MVADPSQDCVRPKTPSHALPARGYFFVTKAGGIFHRWRRATVDANTTVPAPRTTGASQQETRRRSRAGFRPERVVPDRYLIVADELVQQLAQIITGPRRAAGAVDDATRIVAAINLRAVQDLAGETSTGHEMRLRTDNLLRFATMRRQ